MASTAKHEFTRFWEDGKGRIIDCDTCGFIHVDPIPDPEQLSQYYRDQYFQHIKPFKYAKYNEQIIQRVNEEVRQSVSYRQIFDKVIELLPHSEGSTLKMLDIGCGNDLLTKYFQNNGWKASAIEPNIEAANYLRKYDIEVSNQTLDQVQFSDYTNLSFVNLQFVLEHIVNPREVLDQVAKAMMPGGVIRVCVPNDFSAGQLAYAEYYKEKYHWVVHPDHINYFSFTSLSRLLKNCGLEERYRISNFPLEFLLLGGINYNSSVEDRNKVAPFINQFEKAFVKTSRTAELHKFYEALAEIEMGRSIFIYATKEYGQSGGDKDVRRK